jgi:RHS repeat-associated protein
VIGNPSTTTTYNYDGEGRRVQKITTSGTTNYVYDAMGHLAAEYGGSSTSAGRVYLSVDALGSTRLVTDASGNPTEQYDYAPFGEELTQGIDGRVAPYSTNQYPTTPDAVTEKFTGKERDAETGLDFFDARYYSSAQGRFTSPDEFKGGFLDAFTGQHAFQPGPLPYADLIDPQTLNKYAYVRSNPLRYVDPDGHADVDTLTKHAFKIVAIAEKSAPTAAKTVFSTVLSTAASAFELGAAFFTFGTVTGGPHDELYPGGIPVSGGSRKGETKQDRLAREDEERSADKDHELQTSASGAGARQGGGRPPKDLTTLSGTLDQVEGVEQAEKAGREGKLSEINSTDKSKQDLKTQFRKIQTQKDAGSN